MQHTTALDNSASNVASTNERETQPDSERAINGQRAAPSGAESDALSYTGRTTEPVRALATVKRRRHFDRDRWLAKKAAEFEALKASCAAHPTPPDDGSPCFVIFSGDPTRTWREMIDAPKSGSRS